MFIFAKEADNVSFSGRYMNHFNINFEPDKNKVMSSIDGRCRESGHPAYLCVADGNILAMVHNNPEYRAIVNGSMLSIVDSSWVPVFMKWIYGLKWEQYCGSQIFSDITGMKKYRMYFLGSSQTVLDSLRANLEAIEPSISSMTFSELPFCSADEFDYEKIASSINNDDPDIIWLSLGAPKQEVFASRLVPYLKRGVVIPVGAVFNFQSGLGIKRAPQWMVRCHLEFAYRIVSEPRKQIPRCWNILKTFPKILLSEKKVSLLCR